MFLLGVINYNSAVIIKFFLFLPPVYTYLVGVEKHCHAVDSIYSLEEIQLLVKFVIG